MYIFISIDYLNLVSISIDNISILYPYIGHSTHILLRIYLALSDEYLSMFNCPLYNLRNFCKMEA